MVESCTGCFAGITDGKSLSRCDLPLHALKPQFTGASACVGPEMPELSTLNGPNAPVIAISLTSPQLSIFR
jgi:hypothetical protein